MFFIFYLLSFCGSNYISILGWNSILSCESTCCSRRFGFNSKHSQECSQLSIKLKYQGKPHFWLLVALRTHIELRYTWRSNISIYLYSSVYLSFYLFRHTQSCIYTEKEIPHLTKHLCFHNLFLHLICFSEIYFP